MVTFTIALHGIFLYKETTHNDFPFNNLRTLNRIEMYHNLHYANKVWNSIQMITVQGETNQYVHCLIHW